MNNTNHRLFEQELDIRNLAQKYDKRLFHFVLRRLRNEEDARDIVQSTYMEAIKSAANFRHESKPETWLMGIALNLTRNQMHKAYHRYEVSGTGEDEEENWIENISINEQSPQEILENKETIEAVIATFKQMSSDMRDTAMMVLVDNLSYEYTAKEMKVPIGTVRSRVARARQMLKTLQDVA